MSLWRRFTDMLAGKPTPPNDDRSRMAIRVEQIERDSMQELVRVQRLVPGRLDSFRRISSLHRR